MKFSKFLLILSSLLLSCEDIDEGGPKMDAALSKKLDSISTHDADMIIETIIDVLTDKGNSITTHQVVSIHVVLNSIIQEKMESLNKLENIESQLTTLETNVKLYVGKRVESKLPENYASSIQMRERLLVDIQKLKTELDNIRSKPTKNLEQHITKDYEFKLDSFAKLNSAPLNQKVIEQMKKIKENLYSDNR